VGIIGNSTKPKKIGSLGKLHYVFCTEKARLKPNIQKIKKNQAERYQKKEADHYVNDTASSLN